MRPKRLFTPLGILLVSTFLVLIPAGPALAASITVNTLDDELNSDGDCALRVGGQSRRWREGEPFVFDDTVEHEAWNNTGGTRTVLLFDFLRPGRTMADLDEPPPEVAAALHRRTDSQR